MRNTNGRFYFNLFILLAFIFVLSIEHLKRKHPAHLNPIIETEEQLDSDLLAAGPSTYSNLQSGHSSSNTSSQQPYISPIPKRPRQLKLFGSTRGNELSLIINYIHLKQKKVRWIEV